MFYYYATATGISKFRSIVLFVEINNLFAEFKNDRKLCFSNGTPCVFLKTDIQ